MYWNYLKTLLDSMFTGLTLTWDVLKWIRFTLATTDDTD